MSIWDERYAHQDYAFGIAPNDFLRENSARLRPGDTLSLGEGEGRNGVYLAQNGHRVLGVDASAVGLAKAQKLARARGVEIATEIVDLADYRLGEARWDNIIAIFVHLPPDLRRAVLAQISGALRPGGVFLAEFYRPEQLGRGTGGPSQRQMLVSADDLRAELGALRIVHLVDTIRPVNEGPLHDGEAATVQIIATKETI